MTCTVSGVGNRAKVLLKNMYVTIFNTDFNIAFVKPEKDRCDLCEKFLLSASENNHTDEEKHIYETHRASVQSSREEKQKDKDKAEVILSFEFRLGKCIDTPKSGRVKRVIFLLSEKTLLL